MKRIALILIFLGMGLFAGCASTIRSDVTSFNEWPDVMADRSFTFDDRNVGVDDLEYRTYRKYIAAQLSAKGLTLAAQGDAAALVVGFHYTMTMRVVQDTQPIIVDDMGYGGYGPWYGPRWRHGYYDPYWGPRIIGSRDISYPLYTRELGLSIVRRADSKKLYDVTVTSTGKIDSMATVMPYLVQSAFQNFPAKSGSVQHVVLKMDHDAP